MNLIDELATAADFYVGNEHHDKSHEERQRLFVERFAELIVLECAVESIRWWSGPEGHIYSAYSHILEHFGVKS